MSLPGWYPDPSGAPGRYRHWDGTSWSSQTTGNPADPPPLGAGSGPASSGGFGTGPGPGTGPGSGLGSGPGGPPPQQQAGGGAGRKFPLWIIGVAVVVVAAVVVFAIFWFRDDSPQADPDPDQSISQGPTPGDPDASTDPNASADPNGESTGPAELICTDAVGSIDAQADQYTSAGMTYTAVPGWSFRYDRSQWTWINDIAAWGTVEDDHTAGIVLGGLRIQDGFTTPPRAAEGTVECLRTYGVWNDKEYQWDLTTGETTVDGVTGVEMKGTVTPGDTPDDPGYDLHIVVLPTEDSVEDFAVWISFSTIGHTESADLIAQAFSTLKKA